MLYLSGSENWQQNYYRTVVDKSIMKIIVYTKGGGSCKKKNSF